MLVGRAAEERAIERLLAGARLGTSGAVVITGEPGIGKSALLDHAVGCMEGLRVLRATGVEAESEIAFAGLLQLLRPALHLLDTIPSAQAAALSAALALRETGPTGVAGDRFAIGAGVLGLVCRYAEEGPVAIVVDDLHLLDVPSAEALVFATRRLAADPVAVLATARTPEADELVAGLPRLALSGLDLGDARELLVDMHHEIGSDERLALLHEATAGNPLALLELADDPAALDSLPSGLPPRVPAVVAASFDRRLRRLDEGCRAALLVAAVSGGDLRTLTAACALLGVDATRLGEAEDAGVLEVRADRVDFRHPLLRAAAYSSAAVRDRLAAHRAVAEVLPAQDVDRRAWHLAEATWHPDTAVSELLAEAAERARARTAYSVASTAFERSARLSPEEQRRGDLLLRAAEAAWLAGQGNRATMLLDRHDGDALSPRGRASALELRATIAARSGSLREAMELLVTAAEEASSVDDAAVLVADAVHAAFYLGDARVAAALADRQAGLITSVSSPRARALALMSAGIADILAGRGGVEEIRSAVPLLESTSELRNDPRRLPWLLLAPLFLRDATGGMRLRDVVEEVRDSAGVGMMPSVLFHVARDLATREAWLPAEASYLDAIRLARETGQATEEAMSLAGLAWLESRMGGERACREHAARAQALCARRDIHLGEAWTAFAVGDLELSLGRPAPAVEQLERLADLLHRQDIRDPDLFPGPELTEALLRLGRSTHAAEVASDFHAAAVAKGQPWALARAERSLGMVLPGDMEADAHFTAALELHSKTLDLFETGRTMLAYGERLRRAGRRVDARSELRPALEAFQRLGAAAWRDRAAAELTATGETIRHSGDGVVAALTPQELQVAMLLADGRTTREAAAALFLSPKTVEYHLRKVYTKLDIRSRADLAAALAELAPDASITQQRVVE